jgi:hypothetical protein
MAALPCFALQRTFVASSGSDINPCNLPQPCRSFGAAIALTDPSGEVVVLDSAGYGVASVSKSLTIAAPPGIYAGISFFSGHDGIDVAGTALQVTLRGLTINGQGGNNGVLVVADNSKVAIENCEISNAGASGVEFTGPDTTLSIRNSVLRGNFAGIHARPYAAGKGTMIVTDSVITDSGTNGLEAHSNVSGSSLVVHADRVTATDNVPSGTGVIAISDAGTSTLVAVSNSTMSGNGFGLGTQGAGSPKMTVSTSVVAGNGGPGFANFGGVFLSRGDNHVHDNNGGGAQTVGTIGSLPPI